MVSIASQGRPPRPAKGRQSKGKDAANSTSRAKTVYYAVERILASEISSRDELARLLIPFSGLEFLQAAEERSLSGSCGYPLCPNTIPERTVLQDLLLQKEGGQQPTCVFCSSACELQARRLAGSLGDEEAATARHANQRLLPSQPAAQLAKSRPEPLLAAGDEKTPIMLQNVQEREPVCNGSKDFTPQRAWNTVDGFTPRLITQPQASSAPDQSKSLAPSQSGSHTPKHPESQNRADSDAQHSALDNLTVSLKDVQLDPGDTQKDARESDSETDQEDVQRLAHEPRDSSDGDSSDQDALSDAHIPWLDEEGMGQGVELSLYGTLHQALEGLITDASVAYCLGEIKPGPCSLQMERHTQVLRLLKAKIAQALSHDLLQELQIHLSLAKLDSILFELLKRFNLAAPVPSLQGKGWEVLIAAMLMSLSLQVAPALRPAFESREAQSRLSKFCSKRSLETAHLVGLCELLAEC